MSGPTPERRKTRRDAAVDPELAALLDAHDRGVPGALIEAAWVLIRLHGPKRLQAAWIGPLTNWRDGKALTLDEAFGRLHPPGTRRGAPGELRQDQEKVHRNVWRLMTDPRRAIGREQVFAEVSRMPDVFMSARTVERRYYEAVALGALNVSEFREAYGAAALAAARQHFPKLWGRPLAPDLAQSAPINTD